MLVDHACILKELKLETTSSQKTSCRTHKPQVARKLAVRHTSVRQLVFWLLMLSSNYTKFHDFSMIIQLFSNSTIFPCMELFLVIFQVFHDFQSLWESCNRVPINDRVFDGCNANLYLFWTPTHCCSVNPDQTATQGAGWSGFIMFNQGNNYIMVNTVYTSDTWCIQSL